MFKVELGGKICTTGNAADSEGLTTTEVFAGQEKSVTVEFKGGNPFHTVPVDVEWGRVCAVLPEVSDEFLCFYGVQCLVVCWTPHRQYLDLISVA